jgi:hypothetical protein
VRTHSNQKAAERCGRPQVHGPGDWFGSLDPAAAPRDPRRIVASSTVRCLRLTAAEVAAERAAAALEWVPGAGADQLAARCKRLGIRCAMRRVVRHIESASGRAPAAVSSEEGQTQWTEEEEEQVGTEEERAEEELAGPGGHGQQQQRLEEDNWRPWQQLQPRPQQQVWSSPLLSGTSDSERPSPWSDPLKQPPEAAPGGAGPRGLEHASASRPSTPILAFLSTQPRMRTSQRHQSLPATPDTLAGASAIGSLLFPPPTESRWRPASGQQPPADKHWVGPPGSLGRQDVGRARHRLPLGLGSVVVGAQSVHGGPNASVAPVWRLLNASA